jgi:nicotinate-nucleotide adenylyltransferase
MYPTHPLFFIVGADNLCEIQTWNRYREILEKVTLCVTERPGYSAVTPPELVSADIRRFPSPYWGLSSTLVRSYLARGYCCRHLLPDGVREYIFNHGLYRNCAADVQVLKRDTVH